MKRGIIFLIGLVLLSTIVIAEDNKQVDLVLFYGASCPHCHRELTWLEEIEVIYPDLNIIRNEVYNDAENQKLYAKFADDYGVRYGPVPSTFIGDENFLGFSDAIAERMEQKIKECLANSCELLTELDEPVGDVEIKTNFDKESSVGLAFLGIVAIVGIYLIVYWFLKKKPESKKAKKQKK